MAKFMRIRHRLRKAQRNLCCYCARQMGPPHKGNKPHPTSETIEHLRRRTDGGTNAPDNLALACSECNTGRGSMDWLTYKTVRTGEIYGEDSGMNWRDWYPEGSTVFVGRDRFIATHNEHGLGLDLYCLKTGDRAMTIAPEYVPVIASGIKYPDVAA